MHLSGVELPISRKWNKSSTTAQTLCWQLIPYFETIILHVLICYSNLHLGAHTIGQARCTNFRARIYNETKNLDSSLAQTRTSNCPRRSGSGDNNLAPLDLQSPTAFDNNYFKNLVNKKGLLHSDQQLYNGGSTDSIVRTYNNNPSSFASDFAAAMIKMGDINPLTGSSGEIRKNCRMRN